jgi:NAD(P)-dependent dehydrogenase (short-subunit alcohol dehydrogenase family)
MKRISELMSLKGRVALITGGAGHIGSAMAEALAEIGANIVLLDISLESCLPVCERISMEYAVETLPLAVNLAQEEYIRMVPDGVVNKFGRLDILVNCAAFVGTSNLQGWITSFEEQSADTWRKALNVNLTAPFILTQACIPALKESGNGSVINIASIYGLVGPDMRLYEGTDMGNPAAYAASKGGILQLTRWLATVLSPDIRVNAITPGGLTRDQLEDFQRRYVERTPLRRMAKEEDLKGAVVYLASDMSAYVTGHNLIVDGGWIAW